MRIAITGVGCVSPLGTGVERFTAGWHAGHLGVSASPWATDAPGATLFAAVAGFSAAQHLDATVRGGTDRFAQYALVACDEALAGAGLGEPGTLDPLRTAVVDGTSMGGFYSLMEAQHRFAREGVAGIPPKAMLGIWSNMAAAQVAIRHGLHGVQRTVTTACASSLDALGLALDLLRSGRSDVVLCGGSEGGVPAGPADGFVPVTSVAGRLLGMETPEVDPELAVLPFDARRRGIVFGEGAAWMVLETAEHAAGRGAPVLGWLLGTGSCADAHHPSSPEPTGRWEAHAIDLALADAAVAPRDVDLVFAHATGTPKGDLAEARALRATVGDRPPVTALKGHTGHTGASSGAMSVLAALDVLAGAPVEPIRGTSEVDPQVDLDLVLTDRRHVAAEVVLVDAFGFGGQNAAAVLAAPGSDRGDR
ncbi:MAG: beta-ketoacyl-[acyl-carrier-protein] synthase family protein [Acidimicrobiales bacterium]